MQSTPTEAVASTVRAEAARRLVRQPQIAAALGLNQQQTSRRMLGQTPFTVLELTKVAKLLEVSIDDLLAGADLDSAVSA